MSQTTPSMVVIHPIVLLSVVDHYNRIARDTKKRVVGVLLGSQSKGVVDVTNSYAVPFEEDDSNPKVWFLDHFFHEQMWEMFKKVNAKERIVGWYSSGPQIKQSDLAIHGLFKKYLKTPTFVIIDIKKEIGLPTKGYITKIEANEDGSSSERFNHIASMVGALEVEEVGVEHLLRDVKDTNISTLSTTISQKIVSLKSLIERLGKMRTYLEDVAAKKLPINQTILNHIQEIFNLLPNLQDPTLLRAFNVQTNDQLVAIYIASIIRSIIALHNLINNKLDNQEAERKLEEPEKPKEDKTDKAKADKDGEKKVEDVKDKEKK